MSTMPTHRAAECRYLCNSARHAWLLCVSERSLCACKILAAMGTVQGRQTLDGVHEGFDTDARIDRSSSLSYQKQDACKACISRWLLVRSLWQDLQQVANELVHSRTPTFLLLHRHAA